MSLVESFAKSLLNSVLSHSICSYLWTPFFLGCWLFCVGFCHWLADLRPFSCRCLAGVVRWAAEWCAVEMWCHCRCTYLDQSASVCAEVSGRALLANFSFQFPGHHPMWNILIGRDPELAREAERGRSKEESDARYYAVKGWGGEGGEIRLSGREYIPNTLLTVSMFLSVLGLLYACCLNSRVSDLLWEFELCS